jgi:hypothetical protein
MPFDTAHTPAAILAAGFALLPSLNLQAAPARPTAAQQAPARDFSSIEIIAQPTRRETLVAVREVPVTDRFSFSGGYTFSNRKFVRPTRFALNLYGTFEAARWDGIEKVMLHMNGAAYVFTPEYEAQRAGEGEAADITAFESLLLQVPERVARQMARNGGMRITTVPPRLDVFVPASALARWKQLVDSVEAVEREVRDPKLVERGLLLKNRTGLPLQEQSDKNSGARVLNTATAWASGAFGIRAMAITSRENRRTPYTLLYFIGRVDSLGWQEAQNVTLALRARRGPGRKVSLPITERSFRPMPDGTIQNVVSARVPFKDFSALALGAFSVEIAGQKFAVAPDAAQGLREIVRRTAQR